MAPVRVVLVAFAATALVGCYRHHLRPGASDGGAADSPPARDAGSTRCGSARCALVAESAPHLRIEAGDLVGNVEGDASGLRGAPAIDGVLFELDPCARTGLVPCPTTVSISGVGADLADPAVLAGAVEATIRDRAIVVRADPCPGCDDGHVAAQLLFAARAGDAAPGFDLDLADVVVTEAGSECESRGRGGETSGRYAIRFASTFSPGAATLDEGTTARLAATDLAVRLVRSSFECVIADLPPPRAMEAAEWVIWIEGPR